MKLCWDNIENIRLSKNGRFYIPSKRKYYDLMICKNCGDEYLGSGLSEFCCIGCVHSGRKRSEETVEKIRKSKMGVKLSEEHKKKIGAAHKGKKLPKNLIEKLKTSRRGRGNPMYGKTGDKCYNWKGGVTEKGLPLYNTYAHQLNWCEEVRKSPEGMLEVKCTYCGRWFIPYINNVYSRVQYLKGNENCSSESRFYCSDGCKNACPLYYKSAQTLMKEDAIRAGKLGWTEMNREVQPELRQMVLARDEYKCVKCGNNGSLHCHHILPVATEPLLSADVDNCITLCEKCHKAVHSQPGCRYGEIRTDIC